MVKNICLRLFILLISLSCLSVKAAIAEDPLKNVEIIESSIHFTPKEIQYAAHLSVELKNIGTKKIANANIEVSYYNADGQLIKKSALKDRLTEPIPTGETRKYNIRLNGDVFNDRYAEYPYTYRGKVNEFDVKILSVKLK